MVEHMHTIETGCNGIDIITNKTMKYLHNVLTETIIYFNILTDLCILCTF